jgi:nicotinamide-nucleotide amidase
MQVIFTDEVLPELRAARRAAHGDDAAPLRRTLRTAAVWESVIATRLAPVEALKDIRLAYLPGAAEVRIRVTATGPDGQARLALAEEMIRDLLGSAVYGAEDETLDQVVHRLLAERSATVAVAESLTGGLIGAKLTEMPGSSRTFAGGVIAYATDLKARLLGVPEELLAAHGAVHADVAAAMAAGVRERLGATYGLAVTGVAGPEPQGGHTVGTVHLSVAGSGSELSVRSMRLPVPGSSPLVRPLARDMTVVHALDLLRRRLLGLQVDNEWGIGEQNREERRALASRRMPRVA